ncbi:transient receptor potential cation channel subfamily M member 2-like isoform X2 [Pomacea canaliculata]|uniref:transient receptor potential cation channel subfamily M member 2-like isoform X2 n=1 Tax=Pomacea canaliculata TaxID=400727 RepID=UPI000D73FB4A|nr:transient receptor potential cation channel subfamily M member 2-like isoform X2 [Pomacea canaliculata]
MANQVHPSQLEMTETGANLSKSLISLKYNEEAKEVEEDSLVGAALNISSLKEAQEPQEGKWIREHIKCRECRWFVEDKESNDEVENIVYSRMAPKINLSPKMSLQESECEKEKVCKCGYSFQDHKYQQTAMNHHDQVWKYNTHTSTLPTNAYGEIEFVGHGDKVAKYVRVDTDTDMKTMLQLMMEVWSMKRPNLLISVTGGAKNFVMRARLKEAFRRGLMKAALSTGAWIITGGTNAGVMKHVGEAVRDYGLTAEGQVIAIGVAPWGCVQDKHLLESDGLKMRGKWPAQYRIKSEVGRSQSYLDSNHSHFILVDNGTQRKFATEIAFRAKLEKEISLMQTSARTDAVKVPVALLVLEGGPGTLETVDSAILNNTPAIIIKGSGKCADILAYAAQNALQKESVSFDKDGKEVKQLNVVIDDKLKKDIMAMVEQTFGPKNVAGNFERVERCVGKPHLITVFELESRGSHDVDKAILKALLKANKDQIMDQLKLALAWNRIDVAKSEIFIDERPWPTGVLNDVMITAIQLNRVDFVDLFLDNGVSLKDFLTVRRLLLLYNDIPKNSLLYTLLWKIKSGQRTKFSLQDVGVLLQTLLGDYYQPNYLTVEKLRNLNADTILSEKECPVSPTEEYFMDGDSDFARPAQELFIWAVLMNRQEMAKLFWREGNESTAAALTANSLLKAMNRYTDDTDLLQRLQRNADEFEDLAIGVLNKCYSVNEHRGQDLLIREMPNWGNATCVLIALQADNKRFISQTACQSLLNSIWMGSLSQDNSLWRILLSMFVLPVIFWLIKFHEEERARSEDFNVNVQEQRKKTADGHAPPPLTRQPTSANIKNSVPVKEEGRNRRMSKCTKIKLFYTAPVVIFCFNCISYLVFLGLYSYILIVQLTPAFHFLEGILIGWVFTIFVEEMRQFSSNYAHSVASKLTTYFSDSWNLLDVITISLFVVGMVLRFIPDNACFEASRVFLSINLISFFFRILHIFSVNKELGPKLVMIGRMVRDLLWFVVILLVFIGAYSIASQAVLFPNTELSWSLLYQLPRKAYWQIYGELFLDDIEEGDSNCVTNTTSLDKRCPSDIGRYFVPVLLGIYMLLTNVLLLNLLIAMFSYTFEKVQQNTDIHWKFQRFNLVEEYYCRPFLPPPLMIVHHMWLCVRFCCKRCSKTPDSSDFRKRYENPNEEKQLVQWENIIADNYLTKMEAREADSVESRVRTVVERLELLSAKVDDMSESQHVATTPGPRPIQTSDSVPVQQQVVHMSPQLHQRMAALEEHMTSTSQVLSSIMKSMEVITSGATTTSFPGSDVECLPNHPKALRLKPIVYSPDEKKLEKPKSTTVKQLSLSEVDRHSQEHIISRSAIYPGSFVERFPVPNDKVSWDIHFPQYDPVNYTAQKVLQNEEGTDAIDLLQLQPNEREGLFSFNKFDEKAKISRVSLQGKYKVVNGLPLNPVGRTGIIGRGLFGRWGPNIGFNALVTRWKRDFLGNIVIIDGKRVLEFIAIRSDSKKWSIPGGVAENMKMPWQVLEKYFLFEPSDSIKDDLQVKKAKISQGLNELSKHGEELYKGYADDARNTDNAWLETHVINYHDDDLFRNVELRATPAVEAVAWCAISNSTAHGSHMYFLKLAAEKHNATF